MQKFFSLVCAVLLVFSASAAPAAQKAQLVKKAPAAVEQMQKVQLEKAQVANFNQLSAAPALTVSNQKGKVAPIANKRLTANHQAVPAKPAARKAANAVAEDINVTATSVYFSNYYGYYDYYMYVDGGAYDFSGIEPIEGKTYTLADMDADYTGWYSNEDGGYITTKATAATLTVSKKNGLPYVVGTMTLGGNNYTITYELKITQTVTINANNLTAKTHYYGGYEYTFNDADWTFDIVDFDMAAKTGTLQNIDFDYSCVYPTGGSSYDAYYFAAVVEDVVVAQDADTLKLTGAIAAENGILYVLDARYEKPAAKEITLVADTLNFFTKMLSAGYYTVDGFNVDSKYEFSFYFISKSITGNFTEEDMDAYSTWVDEKDGKKTLVSYQNLSAANIQVTLVKDTVYYVGTMTLATNDGQEANITLNLSCPFKQEWGEWADFAPFDLNTGKFTFTTIMTNPVTQRDVPVQVRKDNTGLKQYKFIGWGKNIYTATGIDLLVDMNADYTCTVPKQDLGADLFGYGENVLVQDYASKTGQNVPSTYDPETGTFDLALSYFISLGTFGTDYETMVMDKPILERDTVKVNLEAITIEEDVNSQTGAHRGWLFEGQDTDTTYIVQVLGEDKYGTFSYADGTLGKNFYNIIPSSGQGRCQFIEGTVTIAEESDGIHLTGLFVGEDEKAYVFTWFQKAGVLNYDTDAPFDAEFAWREMSASLDEGVIYISATNTEKQTMNLVLFTDPAAEAIPAGAYVISDSEEAGTALQSIGVYGGFLTECFAGIKTSSGISDCWFIVDGTVTLSYDEYDKLKVVVDGTNSWGQPVKALVQYEKLEPKSTVDINGEFAVNEGYIEQYGIINFFGGNTEGDAFDLYAYSDAHIGDFVDVIDFVDCEIVTPNGTVGVIDAYELQVATEDGKHLTLTAKVLGSDTIQYNITATGFYGALNYDTNDDYEGDFHIVDLTIGQSGQYITIRGINEVGDSINFAFVGELVDNAIPAGEYTEVMASTGLNTKNNPTTSFIWNADNYLWFVQSGTLTVNEEGAMHFAGLNSYEKNVVINFIAPIPPVVTDYYLVGWIDGAAYGIEGDIDNFGDYHFVDGKVTATFNKDSYVQVKDNNKQIYGTASYVDPVAEGTSAIVLATGTEKMGVYAGEYEFTLDIAEDGTLTLSYAPVATDLIDINAAVKANKVVRNGRLMIIKDAKVYSVLGQQIQ